MIFFIFKRIILFLMILYVPKSFSISAPISDIHLQSVLETNNTFHNNNEKLGYILGLSFGNYVNQTFEKQKKIGIELDRNSLLKGIQDAISGNLKLSHQDISSGLKELEKKLKHATKIQLKKNAKENFIQGELYMKNFSKLKGVKKTSSGLLYLLERAGEGEALKDETKITVHYKGTLINGLEFDNSYKRGRPVSLRLKDVILGWKEGLKYIKKGGKIKLVIPPNLAYGTEEVNGIPANSTLIFDIELLDVVNGV
ncbi:FKBP-type peptidyl-prolyl cis-trans isomerase [Buchnera aphidicola]|uniref:FKBP-type peptidyl-prolyl cis-trans isomerase n=1 Tax=Buchnera aphidicola TaxID=9 RepID=UPI0001ECFDFF|nr:FKBP-type peptidyl-prolyl cis-trans isomerase [Buchnera aphidicola]ADP66337.1 FKBP-type peptidyl-prolyl cis-trans isomerase FkpA precursor [Buchnera aphidicola str. LL01 (Acyrthosiphon pisum)]ADP67992.1 FKBP-type peptidyl-prolyl cis-trans isomerase FkpA precursor [Buchnera aphidicola str. JF98 (Acyrthosiphon pisum)]OQX99361.1 MAG: peptidylprolyl isomerase [Erwiniaceae bacterium 4572_131]